MQIATQIALSRLIAQQRAMDVTAGNVANANTAGYRTTRMLFTDWVLKQSGAARAPGDRTVAFTQDKATWRDQRPGQMTTTGNPLDLALGDPAGYFTVRPGGGGVRLTRAGHFSRSPAGSIVDDAGAALLDRNGQPITLDPADTQVTVAADGTLSTENGTVATIAVVAARDPARLRSEGDEHLLADTPTAPVAAPRLVQGMVEGSNVQAVAEVARMMTELREFQFVAHFVDTESERLSGAIDKLSQRPA